MNSLALRLAMIVGLAAGIVLPGEAALGASSTGQLATVSPNPCAGVRSRHLEVCSAYVFNSSLDARWPFYKFGRSANRGMAQLARHRLDSRYTGAANTQLVNQARTWPARVDTTTPRIRVLTVTVSSDDSSATLTTSESWDVRTEAGAVLFRETGAHHTIQMRRVPGVFLHKWVVTNMS